MTSLTTRWHRSWNQISPEERRALGWAFAWFFCILLAYYVVRPMRESMGIQGGTKNLKWLFLGTFTAMLAAVPIYSFLVARVPRNWLVKIVYQFFALNLFAFWIAMRIDSPQTQIWVARVFFVWASVFSLFNTSVFWSVLADIFSSTQAKRMFGVIAMGGTIGAMLGSFLTSVLTTQLGGPQLLWLPIVMLQVGIYCAGRLLHATGDRRPFSVDNASSGRTESASGQPTGGGVWEGVIHVATSPYLSCICLFLLFGQLLGTHFYMVQAALVETLVSDKDQQTSLFAMMNLLTQVLTLVLQGYFAGLILRRMGVAAGLLLLPIVYLLGLLGLGLLPSLGMVVACDIARRGIAYGVTVPSREVLFTVVDREDKYKSKSFIDTVVLRGGDVVSSQFVSFLMRAGLSHVALNIVMIPAVVGWAATSLYLGRWQSQKAQSRTCEHQ